VNGGLKFLVDLRFTAEELQDILQIRAESKVHAPQ
jgi:hypothetical protein